MVVGTAAQLANILWHDKVHGEVRVQEGYLTGRGSTPRAYGVLVGCPCGKRWLSRAPWLCQPTDPAPAPVAMAAQALVGTARAAHRLARRAGVAR